MYLFFLFSFEVKIGVIASNLKEYLQEFSLLNFKITTFHIKYIILKDLELKNYEYMHSQKNS